MTVTPKVQLQLEASCFVCVCVLDRIRVFTNNRTSRYQIVRPSMRRVRTKKRTFKIGRRPSFSTPSLTHTNCWVIREVLSVGLGCNWHTLRLNESLSAADASDVFDNNVRPAAPPWLAPWTGTLPPMPVLLSALFFWFYLWLHSD